MYLEPNVTMFTDAQTHIKQFKAREQRKTGPTNCKPPKKGAIPVFQNGRKLRDYQVGSLYHWQYYNAYR
jgi:hypothetical protein